MLLSVLISGLGFLPMLVIALVVYGVRRIISASRNKNQNYQAPPPTSAYQQNYTPPQTGNPQQPYSPPTPQAYQQNYTPPQGSYHTNPYGTPENQFNKSPNRNTAIPNSYQTHVGDTPPKKRNVWLIVGIVGGVILALGVGAAAYIGYRHDHGETGLTGADFNLIYDNPTDQSYTLILDDWDTIAVGPYSSTSTLDYTYRRNQTKFHWKVLDKYNKLIGDTTVNLDDINIYFTTDGRDEWAPYKRTILINPSRSNYMFWTVSFGEYAGENDTTEFIIQDSVYYLTASVTNSLFILDSRSTLYRADLETASRFSELDFNEYFISQRDFVVLYEHIFPGHDHLSRFNDYRNTMIDLYNSAHDELDGQASPKQSEIDIVNGFGDLIPSSINDKTVARDFVAAIDFVKNEEEFFSGIDRYNCNMVLDSSEVILKKTHSDDKVLPSFEPLHYVEYFIQRNGFWDDQPKRVIESKWDRTPNGKHYE